MASFPDWLTGLLLLAWIGFWAIAAYEACQYGLEQAAFKLDLTFMIAMLGFCFWALMAFSSGWDFPSLMVGIPITALCLGYMGWRGYFSPD